ncbi:hypothetical protein HYQ46_002342 [Verticillium longisporum]|nr:hypothetical protein HYQ44_004939 [Verticillium longisporum]KAG7148780.1 hypothetical protein HYQ46_002342 [Verticillium longisporum]
MKFSTVVVAGFAVLGSATVLKGAQYDPCTDDIQCASNRCNKGKCDVCNHSTPNWGAECPPLFSGARDPCCYGLCQKDSTSSSGFRCAQVNGV